MQKPSASLTKSRSFAGLPTIKFQPTAPADGAIGGSPVAGMMAAVGPDEEAVGVVDELALVAGLPAIKFQPAAPATTRRREHSERTTSRWREADRRFSSSAGLPTSAK